MNRTLFFDPSCLRPYDSGTLRNEAMGGSESSLVRVADALGALVVQHNRTETCGRYLPPAPIGGVETVVINRDSRAIPMIRALYPDARIVLWLHDRIEPGSRRALWLASSASLLRGLSVRIVCVSDTQRRGVEDTLRATRAADRVHACTIYNPVDDSLAPDASPVDTNTLIFFSSPNKGLKFALDVFRALRANLPQMRLLVANPGYKTNLQIDIEGVVVLGVQPQPRLHAEVRGALCTFAPNFRIPETFGLVFAESLALGTPVLAYDCGAAREVIGDSRQVLPVPLACRIYESAFGLLSPGWRNAPAKAAARMGLFDACIERIAAWRTGERPRVGPDSRFALSRVADQWRILLSEGS
jgi:glycosyltransferase involved in cell wall biosynthesis